MNTMDRTDFVTDDNTGGYFVCECEECGHVFSSEHANGGQPIADTGDYDDIYCPECNAIDPPGCENPERVWNVQQAKINTLKNKLEKRDDLLLLPITWSIHETKTCFKLCNAGTVIATLAGPHSDENAALIANAIESMRRFNGQSAKTT